MDGNRHDNSGQVEVGVDDAVLVGQEQRRQIRSEGRGDDDNNKNESTINRDLVFLSP